MVTIAFVLHANGRARLVVVVVVWLSIHKSQRLKRHGHQHDRPATKPI